MTQAKTKCVLGFEFKKNPDVFWGDISLVSVTLLNRKKPTFISKPLPDAQFELFCQNAIRELARPPTGFCASHHPSQMALTMC